MLRRTSLGASGKWGAQSLAIFLWGERWDGEREEETQEAVA